MTTRYITALTKDTMRILGVYLVGGFEQLAGDRKAHRPALSRFRFEHKKQLEDICFDAELGLFEGIIAVENVIIEELAKATEMTFQDVKYIFRIDEFTDQAAIDFLVEEVIAQVSPQ